MTAPTPQQLANADRNMAWARDTMDDLVEQTRAEIAAGVMDVPLFVAVGGHTAYPIMSADADELAVAMGLLADAIIRLARLDVDEPPYPMPEGAEGAEADGRGGWRMPHGTAASLAPETLPVHEPTGGEYCCRAFNSYFCTESGDHAGWHIATAPTNFGLRVIAVWR